MRSADTYIAKAPRAGMLASLQLWCAVALGCSSGGSAPAAEPRATEARASGELAPEVAPTAATARRDEVLGCPPAFATAMEALDGAIARDRDCRWDNECVEVGLVVPSSVTADGLSDVRARSATVRELWERHPPCQSPIPIHDPGRTACIEGQCVYLSSHEERPTTAPAEIPPQNRASLGAPPPRPPVGVAQDKARRLLQAIAEGDAQLAADFFFPREAFRRLKGIADPDGYHERLTQRYRDDIEALHEATPDLDRAEFERMEIVGRGGWIGVREEGNTLPYWASRHSFLHYRVDGEARKLEVRVLITWGEDWYITHLSEFH